MGKIYFSTVLIFCAVCSRLSPSHVPVFPGSVESAHGALSPRAQADTLRLRFSRATQGRDSPVASGDTIHLAVNSLSAKLTAVNKQVISEYLLDSNLVFFRYYNNGGAMPDLGAEENYRYLRGGDCILQAAAVHNRMYNTLVKEGMLGAKARVVTPFDRNASYELSFAVEGVEISIRGYIVGMIAPTKEFHPAECELLKVSHFAALTKITTGNREIILMNDPGLSLRNTFDEINAIKDGQSSLKVKKLSAEEFSTLISKNIHFAWAHFREGGRLFVRQIGEKSFTLEIMAEGRESTQLVFIDQPVSKEDIDFFWGVQLKLPFYTMQRIIKRDSNGKRIVGFDINLRTDHDALKDETHRLYIEITTKGKGARVVRKRWGWRELQTIVAEIAAGKENAYSDDTRLLLGYGHELGLVDDTQRGGDARESQLYARLRIVLDPAVRRHYLAGLVAGVQGITQDLSWRNEQHQQGGLGNDSVVSIQTEMSI